MASVEEQLLAAMGERRGVSAADRLCEACVDLLDIDAAAVSVVFDGANVGTLGASGPAARIYDEMQFTHGEGPCLDAVAGRSAVAVPDLADPSETRWPAYGAAMVAQSIRVVYAMPIVVAGLYVGALDLFHAKPTTMTTEQVIGAFAAAELVQIAMLDVLAQSVYDAAVTPGNDAWTELDELTRTEVNVATGMVMAQLGISGAAALVRLRAHAYATGCSATAVANDIIERRLTLDPH